MVDRDVSCHIEAGKGDLDIALRVELIALFIHEREIDSFIAAVGNTLCLQGGFYYRIVCRSDDKAGALRKDAVCIIHLCSHFGCGSCCLSVFYQCTFHHNLFISADEDISTEVGVLEGEGDDGRAGFGREVTFQDLHRVADLHKGKGLFVFQLKRLLQVNAHGDVLVIRLPVRVGETERKSRDSTIGHALGYGHGVKNLFFIGGCVNKQTGGCAFRQVAPADANKAFIGFHADTADLGFVAEIFHLMCFEARTENHIALRRELFAWGTDIHTVCVPTDEIRILCGDVGRQGKGFSCLDKQIFFFYIILVQNGDLTESISVYFLGRNLQFRFRRCAVFLGKCRGRQHREHHQECQKQGDRSFEVHLKFLQ